MDKDLIKQRINTAFENFKAAIQNQTDINTKRADGGWTIGEIANHIVKGTGANLGDTKKTERPYDEHADSIKKLFLNFNAKFPSAPFLQPDLRTYSIEELMSSLDANRQRIFDMIDRDDLTETCVDIPLPVWGCITKYEWLVLFENHIIRHTNQINQFETATA